MSTSFYQLVVKAAACILMVGLVIVCRLPAEGHNVAQTGIWGNPVNLSQSTNESLSPSVVADSAGSVHVIWCEAPQGTRSCNVILYSRIDGNHWTTPLDILVAPDQQIATSPALAIDKKGILHLVWVGNYTDQLFYSQAYAPSAQSTRNWSAPRALSDVSPSLTNPSIAVDSTGGVHVAFTHIVGADVGVYYTGSADSGQTWSMPISILDGVRTDRVVDRTRLVVDEAGGIHVVWTEAAYPDTFPPLGIRYSSSTDGGNTWSKPIKMVGPYDYGDIVAIGEKELHIVWSGTLDARHKFHSWSTDRGATWSSPAVILEQGGYEGWPSLTVDSREHVHLVQVADALYHQTGVGSEWSPAEVVIEEPRGAPHNSIDADLAIGLGNELHVVVSRMTEHAPGQWSYDIYYAYNLAEAPPLPVRTLAQATATPAPTKTQLPTQATEISQTQTAVPPTGSFSTPDPQLNDRGSVLPILVSTITVLLLIVGVVLTQLRRRSH